MISFEDIFGVIRRRFYVIVLATASLFAGAVALTAVQTPTYEASIEILVGQESGEEQIPTDVAGLQQLTQTLATAVSSRTVVENVIQREDLQMTPEEFIQQRLGVEQIGTTQFIEVTYSDADPQRASEVANAIGEVFTAEISGVSPSGSPTTATVWEAAAVPDEPASPEPLLNASLGLVLGAMLGLGLAFLLDFRDDSWRSPEEAEEAAGIPALGVIPRTPANAGKDKKKSARKELKSASIPAVPNEPVIMLDPDSAGSEAYRALRAKLLHTLPADEASKVLLMTSAGSQEGKDAACANLGVALAQAGKSVLLLDCDLQSSSIHGIFGLNVDRGMAEILEESCGLDEVFQEPLPGMWLVPTGAVPHNPADLLYSRSLSKLLSRARESFDYVLINGPSGGSGAMILANVSDGALLVLDPSETHRSDISRTVRGLESVDAGLLGIVATNVKSAFNSSGSVRALRGG